MTVESGSIETRSQDGASAAGETCSCSMTEGQVKASFRLMGPLDRLLYFEHLTDAKDALGIARETRSLQAANTALARTIQGRRWRRENREKYPSWPWALIEGEVTA